MTLRMVSSFLVHVARATSGRIPARRDRCRGVAPPSDFPPRFRLRTGVHV